MTKSNFRRHLVRTTVFAGLAVPLMSHAVIAQESDVDSLGDL